MPPHSLTNLEIQKYYQNEHKYIHGAYSINNLRKIKDGTYVINLDVYESIEANRIALYVNANNVTYFNSFGGEHISKKIKNFIRNKNIVSNIYKIQAYDSIMCGYFCIGFIDFMLKGKVCLITRTYVLQIIMIRMKNNAKRIILHYLW